MEISIIQKTKNKNSQWKRPKWVLCRCEFVFAWQMGGTRRRYKSRWRAKCWSTFANNKYFRFFYDRAYHEIRQAAPLPSFPHVTVISVMRWKEICRALMLNWEKTNRAMFWLNVGHWTGVRSTRFFCFHFHVCVNLLSLFGEMSIDLRR